MSRFQNDRGKLTEEFRGGGMVHLENRWYYTGSVSVLGERPYRSYVTARPLSSSALCLVLVGFLALAVTLAIWERRQGGGQETEIIYDLIGALDQVEKGDLDVSLKITSGDGLSASAIPSTP